MRRFRTSRLKRSTRGDTCAISKTATYRIGGKAKSESRAIELCISGVSRLFLDYKPELGPRFFDTKEALPLVNEPIRAGDVMTFNGFIVKVPVAFGVRDYDEAVIWCEVFEQFVSAAEYQPSHQARK